MSLQRKLISDALRRRFIELRDECLPQLAPENFDAASAAFISQARERLLNASLEELKKSFLITSAPDSWMASDTDCLDALRRLSTLR